MTCPRMSKYMIGSIVGPPGAGKTTQGDFIEQNYCICQFELGPLQRDAMRKGNEFGKLVEKYYSFPPTSTSPEYFKV